MAEELTRLPEHGSCFICGAENPKGLGAVWYQREDGTIVATVTFTVAQQGPPGYTHGGASAAVLDEAMGAAVWRAGYNVVLVHLSVDYRRPLPLNEPIAVVGALADREGRAIHARGELRLPDGSVAVVGRGIYVEAPHLFETPFYRR